MKAAKALLSTLSLAVVLSGCDMGKRAGTQAPPKPPEMADYTPDKDGEWLSVDDVEKWKKNPSLVFKMYGKWIFTKYFGVVSMRDRASARLPANTALKAVESEIGKNPSISYSCTHRKFSFSLGTAQNGVLGKTANKSYIIHRIDGKKHFAEKTWQSDPDSRKLEKVEPATGDIGGKPAGVPESWKLEKGNLDWIDQLEADNPFKGVLTAKTYEVSVVPDKDETTGGFYARWDFDRTLQEQQKSGDLDRACQMMTGADYITVETAKPKVESKKN